MKSDLGGERREKCETAKRVTRFVEFPRNFRRDVRRAEYKTKRAAMKFPSTVALLISAYADGNLKILRIYVSNFTALFYVRSTLPATRDDTSPGACSAITEG